MANNRFHGVDRHARREPIDVPLGSPACPCLTCRIARAEAKADAAIARCDGRRRDARP